MLFRRLDRYPVRRLTSFPFFRLFPFNLAQCVFVRPDHPAAARHAGVLDLAFRVQDNH